jgi:hypothetical protein
VERPFCGAGGKKTPLKKISVSVFYNYLLSHKLKTLKKKMKPQLFSKRTSAALPVVRSDMLKMPGFAIDRQEKWTNNLAFSKHGSHTNEFFLVGI